ncbi:MAG: dihydropteroate synthase [Methanomassiliicoccaceae archaeon]|nr:dihydropteroate synthase [Methanomassiliicoccaceae archaeon]
MTAHPSDLWLRPSGRPLVMGILNVTPDSFSDGGAHPSKRLALEHAYRLIDEGADMIDVGGESSRPGAAPVSEEEELDRVVGVIRDLSSTATVPISVDTAKPRVAERAVWAGAAVINDIWGLRDDAMARVAASNGAAVVIMHMHGSPATLATDTMAGDALGDIRRFLEERAERAIERGVRGRDIILDPGVGFGKTPEQDSAIIENSGWIGGMRPVMVGPSRKRFLSHRYPGMGADEATAEACRAAAGSGARVLRVHDVGGVVSALGRVR